MSVNELREIQPDNIAIDKVPSELDAEIVEISRIPDKKGKTCLFIKWKVIGEPINGKDNWVEKYSPYHIDEMIDALETLKLEGYKVGQKFHLKAHKFGMGFDRHIPVKILK